MKPLPRFVIAGSFLLPMSLALGHSAMEPMPRSDGGWQDRQATINQRVREAGAKAQVIFLGDSITQGWEGAGKDVWDRYYSHRSALNLGIGGDRTQHVLWRMENGNLEGLKPKAAVVMIGTNNSNGEDNSVEQIAEGVSAIVLKLRSELPDTKILLVAIFPRSENPTPQRGKILMVNQIIRRLADERNVFWIDFGHQFLDAQGRIPRSLMPDYLHLTPAAYGLWAEAIEDRLSSILGDERVRAVSDPTANLTGNWIWSMQGPDGNSVEAALVLRQDGFRITGRFARDESRWLEIEDGTIAGNRFAWIVKRDRPGGGIMTYHMTGTVEGNAIAGRVTTEVDGSEVTSDWGARRN